MFSSLSLIAVSLMALAPGLAQASPGRAPVVYRELAGRPAASGVVHHVPAEPGVIHRVPAQPVVVERPQPTPVRVVVRPVANPQIVVHVPRGGDRDDEYVAEMFRRHTSDLRCENLGNLLRRVSNEVLAAVERPARFSREKQLKRLVRRPAFHQNMIARLTELYLNCNKPCFDDGVAIGVLSGTGYCNAAIGVDGLPDAGFLAQSRLPVCETENFMGCQSGYAQAVNSVQGCLAYATGRFAAGYEHQISQDCHVEQP
jgi:hypothetical protein